MRTPVIVRLSRRLKPVLINSTLGECWEFQGGRTPKGHGRIRDDAGKLAYPHRIALAAALGRALLPGMFACHRCDYEPCARPAHLYEGTQSDNERDKWQFIVRPPTPDTIIFPI
jgi:hypothetical protein